MNKADFNITLKKKSDNILIYEMSDSRCHFEGVSNQLIVRFTFSSLILA